MSTITVKYYDPEINLDGTDAASTTVTRAVAPIRENLRRVLETYRADQALFRFSFFEAFGIPPYAHIVTSDHFGPGWTPGLKNFIKHELLMPYNALFQNPDIIHDHQHSNYIEYVYNRGRPMFEGSAQNKIHLFVKQEYILYAALKIASLRIQALYPENKFIFKFQLFNRSSNLRPENTGSYDIRTDGGITPTIVIYGSSDNGIMSRLLNLVLELFRGQEEEIGLMDDRGSLKLSPFNIRLNNLVSYAAGDRGQSLDAMLRNIGNIRQYTEYTIPRWLTDMQSGCTAATRDEINRRSQLFIGVDACDEAGAAIDYAAKCREARTPDMKYCYLTTNADMLDPRAFVGGRRTSRMKRIKNKRSKKTRRN
jgi:hypothetical protein